MTDDFHQTLPYGYIAQVLRERIPVMPEPAHEPLRDAATAFELAAQVADPSSERSAITNIMISFREVPRCLPDCEDDAQELLIYVLTKQLMDAADVVYHGEDPATKPDLQITNYPFPQPDAPKRPSLELN